MALIGSRARFPQLGAMPPNLMQPGGFPLEPTIGGYGGGTFNYRGQEVSPQMGATGLSGPSNPGLADILMQAASQPALKRTAPVSHLSLSGPPPADDGMKLDPSQSLRALDGFQTPKVKRPFITSDGTGTGNIILGALADAFAAAGGGQPTFGPMMMRRKELEHRTALEDALWQRRHSQERQETEADRQARLNDPQYFTAGNDRVRYDPASGQSNVLYHGPMDAENYATALGYDPGTDDYRTALQDYTLKSWGPTANEGRMGLEGERQSNRIQLRGMPTYAQTHKAPPRPRAVTPSSVFGGLLAKQAAGGNMTAAELATLAQYRKGNGGGRGGSAPQATAIGPDGHKLVVKGGKWVDAVTGKPVQ